MRNPNRIRAVRELRQMCEPNGCDGDPDTTRERLQSILQALTCCERDSDADGNCPTHRERRD